MEKKLFCERSKVTYNLSVLKERLKRYAKWIGCRNFASTFQTKPFPINIYKHRSLIRRKLGDVDLVLQDNKAINLSLAAPKINGILIKPGEVFSFWYLVGKCSAKEGYKQGLMIKKGKADQGIGGGMCQFTNLLHWMILHSPLDIIEHHHHNQYDLFPDFNRQIPFGTGTSIMYNYLDYQVKNNTANTFQILVYTNDMYLCGELNAMQNIPYSYHIQEKESCFKKEEDTYYRYNKIFRKIIDKKTGKTVKEELMLSNKAKVMYDEKFII